MGQTLDRLGKKNGVKVVAVINGEGMHTVHVVQAGLGAYTLFSDTHRSFSQDPTTSQLGSGRGRPTGGASRQIDDQHLQQHQVVQ